MRGPWAPFRTQRAAGAGGADSTGPRGQLWPVFGPVYRALGGDCREQRFPEFGRVSLTPGWP